MLNLVQTWSKLGLNLGSTCPKLTLICFTFLWIWHHLRVQSRSQSGPKSLPKWSKIELQSLLQPQKIWRLGDPREITFGSDFGSDLGAVWGIIFEPKSVLDAISKAVARGSVVPIPKNNSFQSKSKVFEASWAVQGKENTTRRWFYIGTFETLKIIDFLMENHYFYYFMKCRKPQKRDLLSSLKDSWLKVAIKFRKNQTT